MTESTLTIGGLALRLTAPFSLTRHDVRRHYAGFDVPPVAGTLALRLVDAPPGPGEPGLPIFATDLWTLTADSGGQVLTSRTRVDGFPSWSVRLPREGREAVLYHRGLEADGADCRPRPNPLCYPLDQVLFMLLSARFRSVLVHAAGVTVGGRGILLPGVSGAGKSTISRLLDAAGHRLLSDDRVVVRQFDDGFRIFGTPWPGDAGFARNEAAPLGAVCFLRKAAENRLVRLSPLDAFARLAPVASIPWFDREAVAQHLDLANRLFAAVPAYDLHFTPDPGAVEILRALA